MGIDISEPNKADKLSAYFEIKVRGSKEMGTLFLWADRPNETDPWNVPRLELQIRDDDQKRLLIKKESDPRSN